MVGVVVEQFKYFGPFPAKFEEIADPETVQSIILLRENIPKELFSNDPATTEREVSRRDIFISKMMKLDWRDRPTAEELLEDEWWDNDEE